MNSSAACAGSISTSRLNTADAAVIHPLPSTLPRDVDGPRPAPQHPDSSMERNRMIREPLIMVCTCEMAGRVRGKGFPASELPARLASGVGWIPTNGMISALGPIADSPFGAKGDLLLIPDQTTETRVDFGDAAAAEHFILGDIRQFDGTAWPCCPREFLRRALTALQNAAGLSLFAAFEHEFIYDGVPERAGAPYSLDS